MTVPRFIICQNPACGQVHQVRRPYEQRYRPKPKSEPAKQRKKKRRKLEKEK